LIDVFAIVEDLARRRGVDAGRISVIELNRSGPAQTALALLAFQDGSGEPLAFIKASTDAARAMALRREFDNLTRLARGDSDFRRTIPEPLYCEELGSLTVLAEAAGPGTRMKDFPPDAYFASRRFRDTYATCVRWLAQLDETLSDGAAALSTDAARMEIERYRQAHRVSPTLDGLLDESIHAVEGTSIPGVPSHGDFCTANVIVRSDGGLFVIDWEYPLARTWPLADLLYFTSSTWCIPYRKGRDAVEENYRGLFFRPHGFSELIHDTVAGYTKRLGLAQELMLPLSVLCWTAFANRKQDELCCGERRETDHLPLILVREGACINLEILAEERESYLLRAAGGQRPSDP
jgi:hypothetical protein